MSDWKVIVNDVRIENGLTVVDATIYSETAGMKYPKLFVYPKPSLGKVTADFQAEIESHDDQGKFDLPRGEFAFPIAPDPTPEELAKTQFFKDLILYQRMKRAFDLGVKVDAGAIQAQLDLVNKEYQDSYLDLFGTGQEPV